jgi:predicted lipoprotein with Yx(FWY)xxD motif
MSDLQICGGGDTPATAEARRSPLTGIVACAALAILALVAFPSLAAAAGAPSATIDPAVQIAGGFSLRGTITPNELDTTYHFEYGTTTSYGASVPVPDADAGSGGLYYPTVSVSQPVTGLASSTTYHYRLVVSNSAKSLVVSGDGTFTSPANPNVEPPSEPLPTESGTAHRGKKVVVKEAKSKGKTILTLANGHTLYGLSAERHGKFICTKSSGCLAAWHPLLVPMGTKVSAPLKLGTIERPEGDVQVTLRGLPLYSFAGDKRPGQDNGEGLKDVGTWHPVVVAGH